MRTLVRFLASFVVIVVLGSAALGGSLALLVPAGRQLAFGTTSYCAKAPVLSPLPQRSIVYDRDGRTLAVLFAEEDRAPIALRDVPDYFIQAVLSIEDRSFYTHPGVNLRATARAFFKNLGAGGVAQGGSTITQQLVKNSLFENPQRNLQRKAREALLALCLERWYEKDEILQRYLNTVYFGHGAYGVRAAAERYFRKQPKELTLAEAALLAGLIQNPEGANPIAQPERASRRRSEVVNAMMEEGFLTKAQVDFLNLVPLPTEVTSTYNPRPDDYFVEEVKKRLLRDERLGATYQERYQKVFRGGLRITTTFDPRLQMLAEQAVRNTIPPGQFTGALVAIDNSNGAVRAIVGGEDFAVEQFNLATQGIRQTGSAFKAITTATALEEGYSPNDIINGSSPCSFPMPGSKPWVVGGHGGGQMPLISALAGSINCAFARLAIALGPEKIIAMAERLGITNTDEFYPGPSITLGANPTSVLDMAAAFSVFAAEGVRHQPMFVSRIEAPDGTVIIDDIGRGEQVLDPNLARTETYMLQKVVSSGTGTGARIDRPVAGKTGTTDRNADAWFVGFTPQLTAAVWMGNPNEVVPMPGVFGGTYPASVFAAFMQPAHEGLPVVDFTPPDMSEWPSPQFIDENGRAIRSLVSTSSSSSSTTSTTVPRSTTTVHRRATTTVPATTTPPPATTTAPPTTPPPATTTTVPAPTTTTAPPTTPPPPTTGGGP